MRIFRTERSTRLSPLFLPRTNCEMQRRLRCPSSVEPGSLADALKGVAGTTANRVRQFLTMDAKTRDPILSTAQQAFQWCDDERMQTLTSESTFSLVDLCAGDTDLFITLPTENLEALAPFLRWLLADLFATIRRNRVAERLIIFVDETQDAPELPRADYSSRRVAWCRSVTLDLLAG